MYIRGLTAELCPPLGSLCSSSLFLFSYEYLHLPPMPGAANGPSVRSKLAYFAACIPISRMRRWWPRARQRRLLFFHNRTLARLRLLSKLCKSFAESLPGEKGAFLLAGIGNSRESSMHVGHILLHPGARPIGLSGSSAAARSLGYS